MAVGRLTNRQRFVTSTWLDCGDIKSCANKLNVSPKTVEFHLRIARKKLNIGPLIWLAVWAYKHQLSKMRFVLMVFLLAMFSASAQTNPVVLLQWTKSTSQSVTNYNVYFGNSSGNYTNSFSVGDTNMGVTIFDPASASNVFFFAVTAQDTNGVESLMSNEVSSTPYYANDFPADIIPTLYTIGPGTLTLPNASSKLIFGE